jgi:hypothetical protein
LISIALLPLLLLGVEFVGTQVNSRDVYIVSTRTGMTVPINMSARTSATICRAEFYDANTGQHIPEASKSGLCTLFKEGRTGTLWYGRGRISGQINYNFKLD